MHHPYRIPGQVTKELPVREPSRWKAIKARLKVIEWGFLFIFLVSSAYCTLASVVHVAMAHRYAVAGSRLWLPYAFTGILSLGTAIFAMTRFVKVIQES